MNEYLCSAFIDRQRAVNSSVSQFTSPGQKKERKKERNDLTEAAAGLCLADDLLKIPFKNCLLIAQNNAADRAHTHTHTHTQSDAHPQDCAINCQENKNLN